MFDKPFGDARQHAPATQRNVTFILEALTKILPRDGHILEIASGSGEHVIAFANALPNLTWQPSDPFAESRSSIDSWAEEITPPRIDPALDLDMLKQGWPDLLPKPVNAIIAINMIHIAPWEACCGLMRGAGALLKKDELLYTYGPYRKNGLQTSESNQVFEAWLKTKHESYGIRDIKLVEEQAVLNGLALDQVIEMPAHNFSLIFKKM